MLAAVYSGRKSIQLKEVPMPELKDIQAPRKFGGGTISLRKEDLVLLIAIPPLSFICVTFNNRDNITM